MTNLDIIRERLQAIEVLESLNVSLNVYEASSDEIRISVIAKVSGLSIHQAVYPGDIYNALTTPSGPLAKAIDSINAHIKERFAPIITEQKEAIRMLL